jgi:hypothetical protein
LVSGPHQYAAVATAAAAMNKNVNNWTTYNIYIYIYSIRHLNPSLAILPQYSCVLLSLCKIHICAHIPYPVMTHLTHSSHPRSTTINVLAQVFLHNVAPTNNLSIILRKLAKISKSTMYI